jgi:cytosine/uracil/thiamine/allantoin permease
MCIFAAFLVLQIYFVRELLAALILFTFIFVIVAFFALAIYVIGKAGEVGLAFTEPAARRGLEVAEELSKKTFHRPRSAPVP